MLSLGDHGEKMIWLQEHSQEFPSIMRKEQFDAGTSSVGLVGVAMTFLVPFFSVWSQRV